MTPGARVQSAIEILDLILVAAREGGAAADTILARWFATRRFAGSKDRRAIREHVYAAIRTCGEIPVSGRAALLALASRDEQVAAAFDGSTYGPAPIGADEQAAEPGLAPGWLVETLVASGLDEAGQAALLDRAPLDIRINRLRSPDAVIEGEPIDGLPDARRLPPDTNVERLPEWSQGAIEVQDAGSQLVTLACRAVAGERVVDLCAGAGGKTLALAAMMGNSGEILATDTDRARLQRLSPRAERAGVTIATTRLLDPGSELEALDDWRGASDLVLVDAPCSGTGTWRRNPEARWRLTPARLERLVATQERLLGVAAELVRPGGRLVYVVCSLLDAEGRAQIEAFAGKHDEWRVVPLSLPLGRAHGAGIRLDPAHDATDGFFVAMLERA